MSDRLNRLPQIYRQELLQIYNKTHWGDLPSGLSSLEIIMSLYWGQTVTNQQILKHRPLEPSWDERDYFVLSKIQALPVYYYLLAQRGYFELEEIYKTQFINPELPYLPHIKTKGINAACRTTGSGSALATGIAFNLKNKGLKNHVFLLIGDSEIQQGSFWETLLLINHYQIKNLTIIVDYNHVQMDSRIRSTINYSPLGEKISRFGFRVIPVANGHDIKELTLTIEKTKNSLKPCIVLANTVKGYGIGFMENKTTYSYKTLSKQELTTAENDLQ